MSHFDGLSRRRWLASSLGLAGMAALRHGGEEIMRFVTALLAFGVMLGAGLAADEANMEQAKKEEARACVQCHSLRLVHSQRLSTQAWTKEVDKMIGWGAPVHDRQLLIDYYSKEYSDAKPVPAPDRSADDAKHDR